MPGISAITITAGPAPLTCTTFATPSRAIGRDSKSASGSSFTPALQRAGRWRPKPRARPARRRERAPPGGARVLDAGGILQQLPLPVGGHPEGVEAEGERRDLGVRGQLAHG